MTLLYYEGHIATMDHMGYLLFSLVPNHANWSAAGGTESSGALTWTVRLTTLMYFSFQSPNNGENRALFTGHFGYNPASEPWEQSNSSRFDVGGGTFRPQFLAMPESSTQTMRYCLFVGDFYVILFVEASPGAWGNMFWGRLDTISGLNNIFYCSGSCPMDLHTDAGFDHDVATGAHSFLGHDTHDMNANFCMVRNDSGIWESPLHRLPFNSRISSNPPGTYDRAETSLLYPTVVKHSANIVPPIKRGLIMAEHASIAGYSTPVGYVPGAASICLMNTGTSSVWWKGLGNVEDQNFVPGDLLYIGEEIYMIFPTKIMNEGLGEGMRGGLAVLRPPLDYA